MLLPASHTLLPPYTLPRKKAAKLRKRKPKAEAAAGIGAAPSPASTPSSPLTPNHGTSRPVARGTVFARQNTFLELLPQPRPLADAAWSLSGMKAFPDSRRVPGRGAIGGRGGCGGGGGSCHLFRAERGVLGGEGGDKPLPEVVALVRREARYEVFLREQEAAAIAAAAASQRVSVSRVVPSDVRAYRNMHPIRSVARSVDWPLDQSVDRPCSVVPAPGMRM